MKTSWLLKIVVILLIFFSSHSVYTQNLDVHLMLGKRIDQVISKYGKPNHQDRSNKSMECVFYKTKTHQTVFVSNENGVYQSEGSYCFDTQSAALKSMSNLIDECKTYGFEIDTLNSQEYNVFTSEVKLNASLFENTLSKKYEVKIKANRTTGLN